MEKGVKERPFKALWRALKTILFFWIDADYRKFRFDAWTIGLICFITIASTIIFTDALTPLNPSFKIKEAEVLKTSTLFDRQNHREAVEIGSVKKGDEVEVLAYSSYGFYQIETKEGERGWIHLSAFGNEIVVDNRENDAEVEVGAVCRWVKTDETNAFKMSAKGEDGKTYELRYSDVAPVFSFGVPKVRGEDSWEKPFIFVTKPWMEKHFKEGKKLEDIMDKYYGNAISIDIKNDGIKEVLFPLHVKEFKRSQEHETVKVVFQNDEFVSYSLSDPDKMKFIERWIPFGQRIVGNRLFIKLRSHTYVEEPEYESIDDVLKENGPLKEAPKVMLVLVIIVFVFFCWVVLNSHLLFIPSLMSMTCRIKSLSNHGFIDLMQIPAVIYLLLAYLIFLPYWIIIVVALIFFITNISAVSPWVKYCRCDNCKEMHKIITTGWSEPKYYEYDEYINHITEEVRRSGARRIVNSWVERRRHKVKVQKEYLKCTDCGHEFEITHHDDKVV